MGLQLFGLIYNKETKNIVKLLENNNKEYKFIDLGDGKTKTMEMLIAITGSTNLPHLFNGGESYLGEEQIRQYIGS